MDFFKNYMFLDLNDIYLLTKYYNITVPFNDIPQAIYSILNEQIPSRKFSASMDGDCVKQNVAKYKLRPGPPYKAASCKNMIIQGNDEKWYKSLPNAAGIYTWRKVAIGTDTKASKSVKKASKGVKKASKGVKKASKSVKKVSKRAKKASKRVNKASKGVKKASKRAKKASKGVKKASKGVKKDYSKMLVKELKEELKKQKLPVSGVKKELIKRLMSKKSTTGTIKSSKKGSKKKIRKINGKKSTKSQRGVDCVLKNACPQRYKLQELKDIAKSCGITNLNQKKKDLCIAIKNIVEPVKKEKLYDVVSQGVMLANEYLNKKTGKPSIDPTGWFASEKFDGVRAVWDGKDFISRSGIKFNAPESYKKYLPNNMVLDGELFLGRDKFQETISIVRHKIPNEEDWTTIKYNVFDLPLSKKTARERIKEYTKIVQGICAKFKGKKCPIIAVKQYEIKNTTNLEKQYQNILKMEGEGMMLKQPDSLYTGTRSKNLLKYKPTFDSEAKITGHTMGEGKYTGKLGAFIVKDVKTKKAFNVGSGLTDEMRKNYKKTYPIGTIITYQYTSLTKDGIPRHPRFFRRKMKE